MEIYTERGLNQMYGKGSLQIIKSNYVKSIYLDKWPKIRNCHFLYIKKSK